MGEEGLTLLAVRTMKDDVLADIAPTRNVMDSPGEFKTQGTCHGAEAPPHNVRRQGLPPLFAFLL